MKFLYSLSNYLCFFLIYGFYIGFGSSLNEPVSFKSNYSGLVFIFYVYSLIIGFGSSRKEPVSFKSNYFARNIYSIFLSPSDNGFLCLI